jgi:isopropylmalate/homocitrate/citramalate synthase
MKDQEIYNIFDTEKILNRPAAVSISNTSGLAGIAYWINNYYRLSPEEMIGKQDALVSAMKAEIDEQYADGRTTIMCDEELVGIVEKLAPNRFYKK